jgi:hypothetical protein
MFNLSKTTILAAVAALCLSTSAHAGIMDFNGLGGTDIPGNDVFNDAYTRSHSTLTINDFTFASTQTYVFKNWNYYHGGDEGQFAENGTNYMAFAGAMTMTTLTAPFSVHSIDLKNWANNGSLSSVTLTGHYAKGGSHSVTLALNTTPNFDIRIRNDFTNYQLSGFNSLSSLVITSNAPEHLVALDNIELADVPEPGSLAILGLGLAVLGGLRRKQQRQA